jgi:hypothetical protein
LGSYNIYTFAAIMVFKPIFFRHEINREFGLNPRLFPQL